MKDPKEIGGKSVNDIAKDYDYLGENRFWDYFLRAIDIQLQNKYEEAGKAVKEEESKVRVIQGEVKAFEWIRELPKDLALHIKSKLGQSK